MKSVHKYFVQLVWIGKESFIENYISYILNCISQSVQTNQYCLTFTVGSGTLGNCPGAEIPTTTEE